MKYMVSINGKPVPRVVVLVQEGRQLTPEIDFVDSPSLQPEDQQAYFRPGDVEKRKKDACG